MFIIALEFGFMYFSGSATHDSVRPFTIFCNSMILGFSMTECQVLKEMRDPWTTLRLQGDDI